MKKVEPTVCIEEIGPDKAKKYLQWNNNLEPNKAKQAQYVEAMKRGWWVEFADEQIRFNENGELINGQKRLFAIIQSGKTYKFSVMRNCPNSAFYAMDQGFKRRGSEILKKHKFPYYTDIATIIKLNHAYRNNSAAPRGTLELPTNIIFERAKNQRSMWIEVAEYAAHFYVKSNGVIGKRFLGNFFRVFSEINKPDTLIFFNKTFAGIGVRDEKEPCHVFRRALDVNRKKPNNEQMNPTQICLMFGKAWNLFRDKKYITRLSILQEEKYFKENEIFPQLK